MRRIAALTTLSIMLLGVIPTASAADSGAGLAEVLLERHYIENGNEVDLAVTRGADGTLVSEATVRDPANGDEVDVWTDGITIWWSGTQDGEPVSGALPAGELVSGDSTQALGCLHPVGALICLGAAALLAGCSYGFGCDGGGGEDPLPSNPPDSGGGGDGHEGEGSTDGGDGDGDE